ncbi:hypothetical protein [Streptomyces sasae]|uniref:hypothetical protein n=1 Tax=Streptomyces sasae TaxID=1266772 RepID=UPI00292EFCE0|nr:hypothetical protein [Streptomyces sasae]
MNRRRNGLVLLLAGALVTALPAVAAADGTPVDPALPTPTVPAGTSCGSQGSPVWETVSTPPPTGFYETIGIPRPTVNGVSYQGVVHAWDADGGQSADGSVDRVPVVSSQSVYVPLPLTDGHTYGWDASTYDGTAYSNPTDPCYFRVDGSAPAMPTVTNPDFPRVGTGTPKKAAGQPTTFSISSAESLPAGCAAAGTPDCAASGLDHFVYGLDQEPGNGAAQLPADAAGRASLTGALSWGVHTLYVQAVDAAGNHSPTAAYTFSVPYQLPPAATDLTLATNASSYDYGATAKLTAHLGPTDADRTLSLYAQPYDGKKTLVATGQVDANGDLKATYKVIRKTTFTAEFAGDDHNAPATAARTVTARARVAESLTGSYTTTHYGSTLYRVYHHTAKAKLDVTVAPAKPSQCVRFQIQRYTSGAWHTESTSACHALTSRSTTATSVTLTRSTGSRFRIRAEYVPSGQDTGNLGTWGACQYYAVRQ